HQSVSVRENTTKSLTAMGNILSDPKSVEAVAENKSEIEELFEDLIDDILNTEGDYNKTESDINNNITKDPGLTYLENLFEGMIGILKKPSTEEDELNSVLMVGTFLEIQEYSKYYPSDTDISVNVPSTSLTAAEKKERLSNMDDNDIKQSAYDVMTYDKKEMSKKINTSVERSKENFTYAKDAIESSIKKLVSLNQSVDNLTAVSGVQSPNEFQFKNFISTTEEELDKNESLLDTVDKNIVSAEHLPDAVGEIGHALTIMSTKDLNNANRASDLKAKGAIGLIQLNSSLSKEEQKGTEKKIMDISEKNGEHSEVRVFAWQIMMEQIDESADKSFSTLLPIALGFVAVVLLLVYRTIIETIVSLLSLMFAITWTFGIGVLMGYNFNPVIIAVPVLVTGLVIDYGIHMVMRYREEKVSGKNPISSTQMALSTVGGALVLTTVTTAIGFLSNAFSDISIMQHFGILAAIGITSSFTVMVIFLPSVVQVIDKWRDKRKDEKDRKKKKSKLSKRMNNVGERLSKNMLTKPSNASVKHPAVVLIILLIITSSAMYGVVNIDTTFNIKDFLPEDRSQSENIEYITSNYNISNSYAYILTEGNVSSPDYLHAVSDTIENTKDDRMLMTNEEPASAISVLKKYGDAQYGSDEYNKTIVDTFENSDKNDDQIPEENVTELYDLLYSFEESRNDIKKVVYREDDNSYSGAIIKIKEDENKITQDMKNAKIMENELKEDAEPLNKEDFTARVTSVSIVGEDTAQELSDTQVNSLIATVIIVAFLLTIVFYYLHDSKILGVITTVPVGLVTIWIVGSMYALGVPLNVLTVSITALTVGMGVDYSIHVTHGFTEKLQKIDDYFKAMKETIQGTGSALFSSTVTTIGAFGILATSEIGPLSEFGYITALAIIYSFLASVLILPSWLIVWAKHSKFNEKDVKDKPVLKKKQ
ncbi:MAG: efflux RND transporter permease subunit, partial [Thermoplasmatota archaeon]